MVLDPLSPLSSLATIVQLINYGNRLLSSTAEIYNSASHMTSKNYNLKQVSERLRTLTDTLVQDEARDLSAKHRDSENAIQLISKECRKTANEIIRILERLQLSKPKKWRSLRVAMLSLINDGKIAELEWSLEKSRGELALQVLISSRFVKAP